MDSCGYGVGMSTAGGMFPDVLPEVWPLPALHAHSPWNAFLVARCVCPPTFGADAVSPVQLAVQGLHKPHNLQTSQSTASMSSGLVIPSWTPDCHV